MSHIECPHCNQIFDMGASGYANIAQQVRSVEFEAELTRRLEERDAAHAQAVELAKATLLRTTAEEAASTHQELAQVKAELEAERSGRAKAIELEVTKAEGAMHQTLSELREKVNQSDLQRQLTERNLTAQHKAALDAKDEIIRLREEEIELRKDMKMRLSTKMLGETLERHCEVQFNRIRAAAFPNAHFEKDNDASKGSKGDYIFREATEAGVEFLSIMFEMKNEGATGRQRNEDLLEKLNKDRLAKGCEYAVLVSVLEPENDLYNDGIVDVSHRYEKMYVIRPQFFIPMITILRNAPCGRSRSVPSSRSSDPRTWTSSTSRPISSSSSNGSDGTTTWRPSSSWKPSSGSTNRSRNCNGRRSNCSSPRTTIDLRMTRPRTSR